MRFFIPDVDPEQAEERYAQLAEAIKRPVPPATERIYAIAYSHDGEEWTARVGEQLRGTRTARRRRRGQTFENQVALSDEATVLAIFAGSPYFVYTNARPFSTIVSHWENPFMAGQPHSVSRFVG